MLYHAYQSYADATEPVRIAARAMLGMTSAVRWTSPLPMQEAFFSNMPLDPSNSAGLRRLRAALELISDTRLTHKRPAFRIDSVMVDGRERNVVEIPVLELPFGTLLKFDKPVKHSQPRVLVVAPLSGHFATLLRDTVRTLLADHEVYVTDWTNARDVPLSAGDFGFEDYVTYLIRFLEEMGEGAHVVAVCQPCVQALAAAALMAEDRNPAAPLSLTLMAGPIDVRESPTTVNDLANSKPIEWFKTNLLSTVPMRFRGGGRRVYPGFVQLMSFMAMNLERHQKSHQDLYNYIAEGEVDKARRIREFYDEYFAVLDLTAEFYIETVERVFQSAELAKGEMTYFGRPVNPGKIRRTMLLTVEGGRDDICAVGQTAAAHDLCTGLPPHLRRHHLQSNVGHYGVFSGRKWQNEIYPMVRNAILSME